MQNILFITSLYPSDDVSFLNNTSVCHYFVKEWVKLGYSVRVFFVYNSYPIYYYPLLKLMNKTLADKSGIAVLDKYLPREHDYCYDGVDVTRIAIKKSRPGGRFVKKSLNGVASRILEILKNENFSPDIILGHFFHPSLELLSILKPVFSVPCAISLHGKERIYSKEYDNYLKSIDYMGYRSIPIQRSFEKLYGKKTFFYCFSGVPSSYIISKERSFDNGINRFIFVGSLIDRKHPTCLIPAISKVFKTKDFSIKFVGDGAQKKNILNEARKYGCLDKIYFTGRINRDAVTQELDAADVFIMLSTDETFGLVYLEAMARGCIVIASKDEGMDGIIKHGINGFLCKAGDFMELAKVLSQIEKLSRNELSAISKAAITTVQQMDDKKMAEEYINFFVNVEKYKKDNFKRSVSLL